MEGTIATDVTTNDYGENGTFVRVYKLTKWWRDELNKRIYYRKSKLHDQSTSALINNIFPHKLFFVWMNENFCWHIWTSFNLLDIYFQHKLNCSVSLLQLNHILHFLKKYIKIDEKKVLKGHLKLYGQILYHFLYTFNWCFCLACVY